MSDLTVQVTLRAVQDIVGRDVELDAIERWLTEPQPPVLVIEGAAGIGKSTLWRAAVERAGAHGFRTLACVAAETEAKLAFTSVRDLFDDAYDEVADDLPRPQQRSLAVTLLREEQDRGLADAGSIAVASLACLRALAERNPVLVAIDDVQWLDDASEQTLTYVLRRLASTGARAILARRAGGLDPPLDRDAREYRSTLLEVGPLSLGAIGRMVHDRLGVAYPRPTLHRLHQTSGGNPFYALELARALETSAEPARPGVPLPVPGTLQELVSDRLRALPRRTLEALTVAASLSGPTVTLVGLALGREPSPDLERAAKEHVIEFGGDAIRFEHPLLVAWVYDLASPARRRQIHQTLAALVPDPEEQARHLALSASEPDAAVASALARAAAGAHARIVAAELYDAAARLTPPDDEEERSRRATAAAAALFDSGDAERAQASLEEVIATTPAGAARTDALVLLGRVLADAGHRDDALTVLQEALETTDDAATTADVRGILATLALYTGPTRTAIDHAEKAIAAARTSGDEGRLAYALAARAMAGVTSGEPYETFLRDALALESPRRKHGSAWDWSPINAAAFCALRAFDIAEMCVRFSALYDEGVESGNHDLEQYGAYGLAIAELAMGHIERAAELGAVVGELAELTGVLRLPGMRLRAEIDGHLGRAEEARGTLRAVVSESEELGEERSAWQARVALGSLELASGRAAAAARELLTARKQADAIGIREPAILLAHVDELEAASEAGLVDHAQEALTVIRDVRSVGDWGTPLVLRAEAAMLAQSGNLADAETLLERAAAAEPLWFLPLQRGRTLLLSGRVARRARKVRAARARVGEALELFDAIGAALWREQARAELGRIGGRAPSSDELTPAERRVAALVAEGKSNKEVAAELVVSVHTIEAALTSIYRKLDVHSRTEMAARLAGAPLSKH